MLRAAWLEGRNGNLSALEQARAWALRAVWKEDGKPEYGMYSYIAKKLTKIGGNLGMDPSPPTI